MKTKFLVILLFFICLDFVHAQTIQNSHYSTTAYIKNDGTIQNSHYATVGYIKNDGTI